MGSTLAKYPAPYRRPAGAIPLRPRPTFSPRGRGYPHWSGSARAFRQGSNIGPNVDCEQHGTRTILQFPINMSCAVCLAAIDGDWWGLIPKQRRVLCTRTCTERCSALAVLPATWMGVLQPYDGPVTQSALSSRREAARSPAPQGYLSFSTVHRYQIRA